MNNLQLFNLSIEHKEPFVEHAYQKELLIIPTEPKESNRLVDANREITEKIIAYKVALEADNQELIETILDRLVQILTTTPNINYSEFTNYWSVNDTTFSSFCSFNEQEKKEFLAQIIKEYLIHRHKIYQKYGYNPVSMQVVCDSYAHKRSGNLGLGKVSGILEKHGYTRLKTKEHIEFRKLDKIFITPDNGDQKLFSKILEKEKIDFNWKSENQNKYPDFLVKSNDKTIIIEHKHVKEGGGGQNKQISEIINFIKQNEGNGNVIYVSFLDGIYFNAFRKNKTGKILVQYNQIIQSLEKNKNNYFLNTAGFNQFLKELN